MTLLEQLTLNTALTLLTYLQYFCYEDECLGVDALAAVCCTALSQFESSFPGVTEQHGWTSVLSASNEATAESPRIDCDLYR